MNEQDDAAPDWSLVSHSPMAFFGLADGFDRKDLKRAYNRLIRRFKPEKHPQEFQRIRGAYELLDNQLRYGASSAGSAPVEQYQWQTDAAPQPRGEGRPAATSSRSAGTVDAKTPAAAPSPAPLPLHVRVRQEPLPDVYSELAKKARKLPYDFYALAVFSDVVDRKDGQQFLRWLLQGLGEYGRDPALLNLLYEYLRGPVPLAAATKILVAVSKTVRTDDFFALTESLWHRVLRERPFAEFRTALKSCEANLRDVGIDRRLAFTIEILKAAIWTADSEWVDQSFALIEENFERVSYHLQQNWDLLDLLRRYIAGRPSLAQASPLRKQLDQALRDFFSADEASRDRSVLQCQILMAENPEATLEAFPIETEEDYSNFYILWNVVTADVAERHAAEAKPADVQVWTSRGRALYESIERRIKGSKSYRAWVVAKFGFFATMWVMYLFVIFVLIGLGGILTMESDDSTSIIVVPVAVTLGVIASRLVQRRYVNPWWQRYAQRKATRWYSEISRGELAAFLQRSQFNRQELRDLLFSVDISNLTTAQSTANHFSRDYGLVIYGMALRFQV